MGDGRKYQVGAGIVSAMTVIGGGVLFNTRARCPDMPEEETEEGMKTEDRNFSSKRSKG